jgi:hypothetical protein
MKANRLGGFLGAAAIAIGTLPAVCLSRAAPQMKMTTEIPANVITPYKTKTRLVMLEFVDGVPTEATAEKVSDHLDFSRAVEAMVMTTPE